MRTRGSWIGLVLLAALLHATLGGAGTAEAGPVTGGGPTPIDRPADPEDGITPTAWRATNVVVNDPSRWTPARGPVVAHPGRSLPTTVILPTETAGPRPLIVFAHGFDTSAATYAALLDQVASAGYVVAAPELPASSSTYPGTPSQADIPNTPADLSAVITALIRLSHDPNSTLFNTIDPGRIGAMGHSDGGSTVAGLALNTATVDPRVSATAILAGALWPIPGGRYGPVNPGAVLVVQGTADTINAYGNGPVIYGTAADPRARLDITGGTHIAPFIGSGTQPDTVRAAIIGFFDSRLQHAADGTYRFFGAANTPGITQMVTSGIGFDPHVPVGEVRSFSSPSSGTVRVEGWTLDPDTTAPIDVRVQIDGATVREVVASEGDYWVGQAYPAAGTPHGFDTTITGVAPGDHQVCVIGVNVADGPGDTWLDCRIVTVRDGSPFGWVNTWTSSYGSIAVTGWMIDPDTFAPIDAEVTVDGVLRATVEAEAGRADVGQVYPLWGTPHGFAISVAGLAAGPHRVCVSAVNVGIGSDHVLECRPVAVPSISGNNDPIGWVNTWVATPGQLALTGWMIDPDTFAPIDARITVDGLVITTPRADEGRADVGQVYPPWSTPHGFAPTLSLIPGPHTICVIAVNAGPGRDRLLECRLIAIPSTTTAHDPFGWVQVWLSAPGQVLLSGWMIDPDTYAPIDLGVWIDGRPAWRSTADEGHADVGQVFPAWGTPHGFDVTISGLAPGPHAVCAYALNTGPGTHILVECRTVNT